MVVGIPVMLLVAAGAVWLLLGLRMDGTRLDAIRTGGTLGVGLGGIVVLWLAVRRQRSTELDLLQKDKAHQLAERAAAHNEKVTSENHAHQLRVAEAAERDAAARRITEQYGKAVDQIGSDKAPIRLGGLYALERLGQDNPDPRLRQTIVNVICAYLRMPYSVPLLDQEASPRSRDAASGEYERRQELEVRGTAQRIINAHLRPGETPAQPAVTFWPDIDLDLTNATLYFFDMKDTCLRRGAFGGANFIGWTRFHGARFGGDAVFGGAQFERSANFRSVHFGGEARFRGALFSGGATFDDACFCGDALFGGTRSEYLGSQPRDESVPDGASFAEGASFVSAKFARSPELEYIRTRSPMSGLPGWGNFICKPDSTDEGWIVVMKSDGSSNG